MLDQGLRVGADLHAALCRGRPHCACAGRGRARPRALGHRFPASERDARGRRSRSGRSGTAIRARCAGAKTFAGGQSGAALWFWIIRTKTVEEMHMNKWIVRAARGCAVLAAAALVVAPVTGAKAAWPEKPIKIVLPFGAGGVAAVA